MSFPMICPNPDCQAAFKISNVYIGRIGRCKKCRARFPLVPATRAEATSSNSETEVDSTLKPKKAESVLPESFGRYEIVRLLGRGGMGNVYLAFDPRLKRQVALKVPYLTAFADRPEVRERFLREAQAAARFQHPNFCPIHDIGEVDGVPYLTMAFIEGKTLSASIERGQGWQPRRAVEITRELALALAKAHRDGIVHRDLKPANVMVDASGGLVLMDFGLARWYNDLDCTITPTGAILGTPAYMSPEQAEGKTKAIGPRSDIYSLGVILYEFLTGRRPFEGPITKVLGMVALVQPPPPSTHRPDLDPRLEAICLKAMAKKADDRYATMEEFAGELRAWLDDPGPGILRPLSSDPGDGSRVAVSPSSEIESFRPLASGFLVSSNLSPSEEADDRRPRIAIVAALAIAVAISGVIYVVTDKGRIKIEVNDPKVVVLVDGKAVRIEGIGDPITLRAGVHDLSINRGDVEVEAKKFVVRRGDNEPLRITLQAPPPPTPSGKEIVNSLGMKLMPIPAGSFLMGSDEADPDALEDEKVNGKPHKVRITRPFSMGATEVTVGQFRQFAERANYQTEAEKDETGGYGWKEGKDNFEQSRKYNWRSPGLPEKQREDHPVVNVTSNDAIAFCKWLSREEGRTYRLPTEAEWEYACRSGATTRFSSGNDPESLATVGNVADGTRGERDPHWVHAIKEKDGFVFTAPVGRFLPNAFGLFDMHGNVWEWCSDWYDPGYYQVSPSTDPPGPSYIKTELRVIRGGSWHVGSRYCRSASRKGDPYAHRFYSLGFRVVLER